MASWFRRELSYGALGPDVSFVQRKLKMYATGVYDSDTEARVRAVQKEHDLPASGIVDEATADVIGEPERHGLVPEWFSRELRPGDEGEDVEHLRWLLGLPRAGSFDWAVETRIRRFQSQHQIIPDGTVSEDVATLLGEEIPLLG